MNQKQHKYHHDYARLLFLNLDQMQLQALSYHEQVQLCSMVKKRSIILSHFVSFSKEENLHFSFLLAPLIKLSLTLFPLCARFCIIAEQIELNDSVLDAISFDFQAFFRHLHVSGLIENEETSPHLVFDKVTMLE